MKLILFCDGLFCVFVANALGIRNRVRWLVGLQVFNCLPFAAIVGKKIFCIHGGLSPELRSMSQIERIKRPCEIPEYGMLCDFLWADPSNEVISWAESDR